VLIVKWKWATFQVFGSSHGIENAEQFYAYRQPTPLFSSFLAQEGVDNVGESGDYSGVRDEGGHVKGLANLA